MHHQLLLLIQGEFHPVEFHNLVSDRVGLYNLQHKDLDHPDVRFQTKLEDERTIRILLDGHLQDLEHLAEIFRRGPTTSHITHVERHLREALPGEGKKQGAKKRKRRKKRHHQGENL